jgi:hypothetical protein
MKRTTLKVLAFLSSLLVGVTFGLFKSASRSEVHDKPVAELNRALQIESVPDVDFPRSAERFHSPDVSIAIVAQFDANGEISQIFAPDKFYYLVSEPVEQRYTAFPSEGDRALASQVRQDIFEAVTTQLKGVRFTPRIVNGKPVSSIVFVTAHFKYFDAEAPRPYASADEGCNEIELSFRFDNELLWQGNTAAKRGPCIVD